MLCIGCGKEYERTSNNQKYCSKQCRTEHIDIDARRAYAREYRHTPQAIAYREEHKEDHRKHDEKYRRKLGQKPVEKMSDDKLRANRAEYMRRWHNTEKGQLSARTRNSLRRARERLSGGSFTAKELENLMMEQNNKCAYCGRELEKYHIDHIKPVSKGGTSNIDNLALSCPSCNLKKGAKDIG